MTNRYSMKAAPYLLTILAMFFKIPVNAQEKLSFSTLQQVYDYADSHSVTFLNAEQQSILVKYQTLGAKLGQWNVQGRTSFSLTDNTKLNTSFVPAELFGGPEGTFRQVTFGQQYVSNVAFTPQIDLINPYGAALVKIAKDNEKLNVVNNLLSKKDLYESVSATYHNILSFQGQIKVTSQSLLAADTLSAIMQNKKQEGLARQQDLNLAMTNQLIIKDKLQQLEVQLVQQYNSLKILCDIDSSVLITVVVEKENNPASEPFLPASGNLLQQQGEWQTRVQESTLRADRRWILPTVSLFSSFGLQQNTNDHFFDNKKWLATSYVGLRLSIPILPEASRIISVKNDRVNLQIAHNHWQHNIRQDQINNSQLELDYQKAGNSFQFASQIELLRKDSYHKNLSIYQEGLLSATDLINSFNDWLNSSMNAIMLVANMEYVKSKITISNTIK